ncbi:hypothetical protein LSAT2_019332 [Lamellibrachia satsuma]|nr:hypothetical protein LSAT2_019332 [Lamellibrachia satsuma]
MPLRLPGQFFEQLPAGHVDDPAAFLPRLRTAMRDLRPTIPEHHGSHRTAVPTALTSATHVFVRHDAHHTPLQRPYDGPFLILQRNEKFFVLDYNGRHETVSIDRLKPAFLDTDIIGALPPQLPTTRGGRVVRTDVVCNQSCEAHFQDTAWLQMISELQPEAQSLLQQFTVTSVIRKASKKQLHQGKVPVMCVLIDAIGIQHTADASVLLRDQTGVIKGTVHHQLLKDYPAHFQTGTALVLRQVGVFSPSTRTHYLNITPNNIVCIYMKEADDNIVIEKLNQFTADDFVLTDSASLVASNQGSNMHHRRMSPVSNRTVLEMTDQSKVFNFKTLQASSALHTSAVVNTVVSHGSIESVTHHPGNCGLEDLLSGLDDEMLAEF